MSRESNLELGMRHPMRRTIEDDLLRWKNGRVRKALLILGERQIGKSFVARRFGQKEYDYFLEINFIDDPDAKSIFQPARSAQTVLQTIFVRHPEFKMEKGRSLLFLDEIQKCPEAVTALKFLVDDGRVDVIASGSMLGIGANAPESYPAGSVTELNMHPMSFEEYLLARGMDPSIPDMIRDHIRRREPFGEPLLDALQENFRNYMLVGGMPECVLLHTLDGTDMDSVIRTQRDLIDSYRRDIQAYAPKDKILKVSREFDLIPAQLGRPNKRIMFNEIEDRDNVGFREYGGAIGWMIESRMVNACINLNGIENPLSEHMTPSQVKLYTNDTGLLMNMMGRETMLAILNDDISVNEGAIAENIVCQMLRCNDLPTFYFDLSKPDVPRMEVDFITMLGSSIAAIEVESGKKRRTPSIANLKKDVRGKDVGRFIKLYNGDITTPAHDPEFEHYPMFCIAFADAMIPEDEGLELPEAPIIRI